MKKNNIIKCGLFGLMAVIVSFLFIGQYVFSEPFPGLSFINMPVTEIVAGNSAVINGTFTNSPTNAYLVKVLASSPNQPVATGWGTISSSGAWSVSLPTPSGATANQQWSITTVSLTSSGGALLYSFCSSTTDSYCAGTSAGTVRSLPNFTVLAQTTNTCASFEYSAWSACVSGYQNRTITASFPSGCTGGSPAELTQTCSSLDTTPVCGYANNKSYPTATAVTAAGLCSPGTSSSPVASGSNWIWTCTGSTNTTPANCSAANTSAITPACGTVQSFSTVPTDSIALCLHGTPTTPSLTGNTWSWTCVGSTNITCNASNTSTSAPVCGSVNAQTFSTAPTVNDNLCSNGNHSAPALNTTGTGWTWNCSNSAGSIGCYANKSTIANPICGSAVNTMATAIPTSGLCSSGTASTVQGSGPWTWTCSADNTAVNCSTIPNTNIVLPILTISATPATAVSTSGTATNNNAYYQVTISSDKPSIVSKVKIKATTDDITTSPEGTIESPVANSARKTWTYVLPIPKDAVSRNWTIKVVSYDYVNSDATLTYSYPNNDNPKTIVSMSGSTTTELPVCVYTYSSWSDCVNGKQTRQATKIGPTLCKEVSTEALTKTCVAPTIEPKQEACLYTYSSWSDCVNGKQTRSIIMKSPENCLPGIPTVEQSCQGTAANPTTPTTTTTGNPAVTPTTQVPAECVSAGITNESDCQMYQYQKNVVSECLANNLTTREQCYQYFINKYGKPLKCQNIDADKCNVLINDVILSDLKTTLTQETKSVLADSSGSTATIDTQTGTMNIVSTAPGAPDTQVQVAIADSPFASSNGNVSVSLVSTDLSKEQQTLAPVVMVLDDNKNGVPDDMDARLGIAATTNRDAVDSSKLSGVDKAIIDGKPLEQPKLNNSVATSAVLQIEAVENSKPTTTTQTGANPNNIRFKGKAKPNQVITLYVYSNMPIVLTVKADANGNWVYDLDKTLVNGKHEVYVAINNDKGKIVEASLPRPFFIEEAQAVTLDEFAGIQDASSVPDQSNMYLIFYTLAGLIAVLILVSIFLIIKQRVSR